MESQVYDEKNKKLGNCHIYRQWNDDALRFGKNKLANKLVDVLIDEIDDKDMADCYPWEWLHNNSTYYSEKDDTDNESNSNSGDQSNESSEEPLV